MGVKGVDHSHLPCHPIVPHVFVWLKSILQQCSMLFKDGSSLLYEKFVVEDENEICKG